MLGKAVAKPAIQERRITQTTPAKPGLKKQNRSVARKQRFDFFAIHPCAAGTRKPAANRTKTSGKSTVSRSAQVQSRAKDVRISTAWSSCFSSIHSSWVWAWAMLPGPKTTVGHWAK